MLLVMTSAVVTSDSASAGKTSVYNYGCSDGFREKRTVKRKRKNKANSWHLTVNKY